MDLKTIYEGHKNMVYNLALQYTQNVQEAEEVTQDVFVKAFQNRSQFEHRSSLKTWLYRITINQSLDYLKAKKRKKRSTLINVIRIGTDKNEVELGHLNHPGIQLEQKEAVEFIFRYLNQLPEKYKTVIILLKIEQLSQSEAAEIMSLSVKAVDSLFQRAKKNLRLLLDKNEGK